VADRSRLESDRRETYRGFESRPLCAAKTNEVPSQPRRGGDGRGGGCVVEASEAQYRMAPLVVARFVGAYLILFAVLMLGGTVVVALAGLGPDLLVVVLAAGLLGLIGLAWWLRTRVSIVRLSATGYRVSLIRGAGVKEARWSEVEDAVATQPDAGPCVVLRLKDGRTTTIPMELLAADKDDFARDVRDHLGRAAR
jgi:hypothetical protein